MVDAESLGTDYGTIPDDNVMWEMGVRSLKVYLFFGVVELWMSHAEAQRRKEEERDYDFLRLLRKVGLYISKLPAFRQLLN
ncbi:hypothetical protein H6G54_23165 [Anabaena cylindrica FACHB-243]|uniref:hypothetical protein n=1 Tax=Anabaena TaxID=1163 RepID=UPI0003091835|nr:MULTISPECIES: hypothetical protein [Anabaena]MBD2420551.1 hypothetical protein [Anabaena cylindrica FACHB-243]MBY5283648.1 hypothetical protein [Anabaena sp. CCAP 1446/1C]MBY5308597.1 hypothetical protein [Anabaena sp. CCAP 1446/1C]MCM2410189.1 hypothetical protein [Anabaena sp. CCAP 1446/1C]BAY04568.1 hypothetical protein NIES19_38330 [Anabaena cylindrica PCC 7122]